MQVEFGVEVVVPGSHATTVSAKIADNATVTLTTAQAAQRIWPSAAGTTCRREADTTMEHAEAIWSALFPGPLQHLVRRRKASHAPGVPESKREAG